MGISKEQLAHIITGRAKNLCNPEGDRLVEGYSNRGGGASGNFDPNPSSYDADAEAFDSMYLSSYDDEPSYSVNENHSPSYSAISNSRMPEDIKRSMLEHQIDTSKLGNMSVLDSIGVKTPPQMQSQTKRPKRQITEQTSSVSAQNNQTIDYSIIKAIINECLNERFGKQSLNESSSLQAISLNKGTISLIDNKGNIFKAKLEKIGNTKDNE